MFNQPHFATPDRLQQLRSRRLDENLVTAKSFEVYDRMTDQSTAVRYAIGAMQPIDPEYTRNTFRNGERVRNQLQTNLSKYSLACNYEYQGSVTNDTHIKARSDIDLLTLHCGFITLEPPQKVTNPYEGNPVQDLMTLRLVSAQILKEKFPAADVDTSGSKSVEISGGSLRRKVDVVASNWRDTCNYAHTQKKEDRGVNILDAKRQVLISNLPFLHNARIESRDLITVGGFRKASRLLKSLKYDSSEGVSLSSYDIVGIVYSMPAGYLTCSRGEELRIVKNCQRHLATLEVDAALRTSIEVPNGTRKVFCPEGASLAKLRELKRDLDRLVYEIENDLTRSFKNLAEARVEY